LLYDSTNFLRADWTSGGTTLQEWYDASSTNRFTIVTSLAWMRTWGVGNEGPASGASTGAFYYYAGFALSTTGWIGDSVE
jgi:hypothetical protein